METIIWLLIITFLIALDAFIQAWLIEEKHIWINHFLFGAFSTIYGIATPYFIFGYKDCIPYFFIFLAYRWLLFDMLLNIFRGLPLLYVGELDGKDALTDRFLRKFKNPEITQLFFKLILLSLFCIISYKYL